MWWGSLQQLCKQHKRAEMNGHFTQGITPVFHRYGVDLTQVPTRLAALCMPQNKLRYEGIELATKRKRAVSTPESREQLPCEQRWARLVVCSQARTALAGDNAGHLAACAAPATRHKWEILAGDQNGHIAHCYIQNRQPSSAQQVQFARAQIHIAG